ncbi:MAG TPA: hypothetical protein VLC54_21185 [Anaeromyxobacter sp.]|nr:hypothetical protein [Anaeromyxobacter sp.]
MARALLVLAAVLLAVPGAFIIAKGIAALRRRRIYVQGRDVEGARARTAGAMLVVYGLAMVAIGAVLVAFVVTRR